MRKFWGSLLIFTSLWASALARAEVVFESDLGDIPTARVNSVDFGFVNVGSFSYRTLRLRNDGTSTISSLQIQVRGDGFRGSSDCPSTLEPQARCYIDLEFRPWHSGSFWGTLRIQDSESSQRIDLYGWGQD